MTKNNLMVSVLPLHLAFDRTNRLKTLLSIFLYVEGCFLPDLNHSGQTLTLKNFFYYFGIYLVVALSLFLSVNQSSAQQGLALVGAWEHTEAATQNTPAFTMTESFNQDGTFNFQEMIAPSPGGVGTLVQYSEQYRESSPSSITYVVQNFQLCGSGGGCMTCPGNPQSCVAAQQANAMPGVQYHSSFRMQGTTRQIDQTGQIWIRIR